IALVISLDQLVLITTMVSLGTVNQTGDTIWKNYNENRSTLEPDFKKEWVYAGANDEEQIKLQAAQIGETHVANSFLDSYIVDADEDPDEEARTYVESNWELFEQAFKKICSEKADNNWRHVSAMMKWSRLVEMKKDIQSAER
ncbi:931_t:CDS:2, partial [Scutellospora calospora]